jgi:hypothetical protein
MAIICEHFPGFITSTHTLCPITLWVRICVNIFLIIILIDGEYLNGDVEVNLKPENNKYK